MSEFLFPGVYMEEVPSGQHAIEGVSTTTTAFLGRSDRGPIRTAAEVTTFLAHTRIFGRLDPRYELGHAVLAFFENGGERAWVVRVAGGESLADGLTALDVVKEFGLLCLPGEMDVETLRLALAYAKRRGAFLIVDPPGLELRSAVGLAHALADAGSAHGAIYYPPLHMGRAGEGARVSAPSGSAAGIYARTDRSRGVWIAASGAEAVLLGGYRPAAALDDGQVSELQAAGVNCIRDLPGLGPVLWGARTLQGGDPSGSEWKYVSVRRLSIYLEHSIDSGTQWAVFEPNDEPLWARVRVVVGAFMDALYRAGAFQGRTPSQAYFVHCDRQTMTQDDLDNGRLRVVVGFAPLKPAEFVRVEITQLTAPVAIEVRREASGEPGMRIRLSGEKLCDQGFSVQVEGSEGWIVWQRVDSFEGSGPEDPHYVLDTEQGTITFGDGVHGAAPAVGEAIQAAYRYGAGQVGGGTS